MNDTTTPKLYDAVFEQYALLARAIVADNLIDLPDVKAERALFTPRKVATGWGRNTGTCVYQLSPALVRHLKDLRRFSADLLDERVSIRVDGFTCAFTREQVFEYKARMEELIPVAKRRHIVTEVKP